MFRTVSLIALISLISFTGYSQNKSGWAAAHKSAHNKEQLATNKSRLDISAIENQRQIDVLAREAREEGLSPEGAMLVDDLLKEAATHIGKRYVWGAKGPSTFDCSGFTGYVYRQFGFQIGPCSREQYKFGKQVDVKNVRKGDLIFFTSRRSGNNVGHVGIVWEVDRKDGSFKFIHASTHRGVVISDFEGYYVNRFVGIKRVID